MFVQRSLLLLTLLAVALSPALAKPDFSGEWKMDASKSDFGDVPAADSILLHITHSEPKVTVKQYQSGGPMGELSAELNYATDGSETKSTVRGSEMTSIGKWSGEALKVTTKMAWDGNEVKIVETWKLTSGGKTLEMVREIIHTDGTSTMKLVFAKSDKK